MALSVGTKTVVGLYLGDRPVTRVILGSRLVWGADSEVVVDDRVTGTALNQWAYSAGWQTSTSDHYTGTAGATATLRFNGSTFALLGATDIHHGQLSVKVDNAAPVTVDAYSASRVTGVTLFAVSGLASGAEHTVVVTALGTKQTASAGTLISIDSARVSSSSDVAPQVAPPLETENGLPLTTEAGVPLTAE
jgi:hypothetical protein